MPGCDVGTLQVSFADGFDLVLGNTPWELGVEVHEWHGNEMFTKIKDERQCSDVLSIE